jgi:hypothetical protein
LARQAATGFERIIFITTIKLPKDKLAFVVASSQCFIWRKVMPEFLRAVSVSYYIEQTNYLHVRGWFLGAEKCDKVVIYNKSDRVVAQAVTNMPRSDVFKKHPQYKDPNPGWMFSGNANLDGDNDVVIVFYKGNKKLHRFPFTVNSIPWINTHIEWLRRRHEFTVVKPGQVPDKFLLYQLSCYGIPIRSVTIDKTDQEKWLGKVDYPAHYPDYCKEYSSSSFLPTKTLQHYLSLNGRTLTADSTTLDVASCHSPLPQIVHRLYGAKAYRQDQIYPSGLKDDMIGGDATNIPLPNNALDLITLHCSWEHFENDADILFIREAFRLLKPGGTLWIGPLYMDVQDVVVTSPHIWTSKYQEKALPPLFSKTAALYFDESICQRHGKFISPKSLYEDFVRPLSAYANFSIEHYENHGDVPGGFPFALVVVKTNEFA